MSRILAIANQKGGVGKTTSCVNLAASLVATKRRVLLVDLDPQGNASMGAGVDKHELESSVYEVLTGRVAISDAIIKETSGGFHLLAANGDLTAAEVELIAAKRKEFRLKSQLGLIAEQYDYILIDCPPSLNMLTVNALVAATGVVIPMQCEYYALEGISALMSTIEKIRRSLNPELKVEGILRTMYDPRNGLTREVSAQLLAYFSDKVYRTVIPRNVRLAEAPSHGQAALHYDRHSRGAVAYLALAGEINRRAQASAR